jgi:hypothetical protein
VSAPIDESARRRRRRRAIRSSCTDSDQTLPRPRETESIERAESVERNAFDDKEPCRASLGPLESGDSPPLGISPLSVSLSDADPVVDEAIRVTQPAGADQTKRCIFEFARALKAISAYAGADAVELRQVVRRWHDIALPVSGITAFSEAFGMFEFAWVRVKFARGECPLNLALARAKREGPPAIALELYPDEPDTQLLVGLCRELQRSAGQGPFWLAGRDAAALIGWKDTTAWRRINALKADKILVVTEKGSHRRRRATRYRYVAEDLSASRAA